MRTKGSQNSRAPAVRADGSRRFQRRSRETTRSLNAGPGAFALSVRNSSWLFLFSLSGMAWFSSIPYRQYRQNH